MEMMAFDSLAEKRRILQLETLYDLALGLHARRPESELVEELLHRVCAVVDPRAALASTSEPDGSWRTVASVGWSEVPPDPEGDPSWNEVLAAKALIHSTGGALGSVAYRELLATPIVHGGQSLGHLVVLDKEERGEESPLFTDEDRRFLESVASLAGVALENVRRVEILEEQRERLEEENRALKGKLGEELEGRRIVAGSPRMRTVLDLVERVAPRGVTVLLRGESGSGKELVARLLHLLSNRSGTLVALNCAALPETLLESELFGIEGGVATGVKARPGQFELADHGTLFLDEIGDLQLALQVKLLRALQEGEIVRVGGRHPISVDVRVVAATHQNLEEAVRTGGFREDLYYRLKGVELELPPLRERREDLVPLVRTFSEDFCRLEGIPEPSFGRDAIRFLLEHDFPGNIRELKNVVEASITLAEGKVDAELVRSLVGGTKVSSDGEVEPLDLDTVERQHIARILRIVGGNKSAAARVLGVHRRTLIRRGF